MYSSNKKLHFMQHRKAVLQTMFKELPKFNCWKRSSVMLQCRLDRNRVGLRFKMRNSRTVFRMRTKRKRS